MRENFNSVTEMRGSKRLANNDLEEIIFGNTFQE